METKTILLIYTAVAFVFEAIFFYFMWRKFKKKMDEPQFQMVKGIVMSIKSAQALKKKIWNPFTLIFAGIPILALVSPFIFPLTLISMLKKLIFGKSKLEKEAEAEQKAMEEAQRKAAEFMKTEGHEHINLAGKMGIENVNMDFNIDLNIDEKKDDKD